MIRIVGVQRSDSSEKEFVLLQNQGGLRINLRGHLVLSDSALVGVDLSRTAHVFGDDALIPPGMYVMLTTGSGDNRWTKTKDGAMVYYAFMGKDSPYWSRCEGPLHVLATQHTFAERREAVRLG